METRESAKLLIERIKTINRYCGEDSAVRLVMIEFIDAFLKKPDPKYWEEVKKEMAKL